METALANHQEAIAALCRAFGVSRLEIFGSAADGRFDPRHSDYDFIARFAAREGQSLGRRFIAFSEALELLLGRRVDLMTDHSIANPYLRRSIDATRRPVYVESPAQASA